MHHHPHIHRLPPRLSAHPPSTLTLSTHPPPTPTLFTHLPLTPASTIMPQSTKQSQQTIRVGIAAANCKRARHAGPSSPRPELPVHLPAGFGGPSAGSGIERLSKADAVAAEETRNALDRAEEETFSNSEPEGPGDSESESEFGAVI